MPEDSAKGFGSRWAALAGIATAASGLLVLLGWWLQLRLVLAPSASAAPMARNTAAGLLCSGVALWRQTARRPAQLWTLACLAIPAVLSLSRFVEVVFHHDFGVDSIFGPNFLPGITSNPAHMSPLTCLCFLLASVGIASLAFASRGSAWPTWVAAITATLIGPIAWTGLLSDLFGIATAIGSIQTASMSPAAAGCFLLLCSGLMAQAWSDDPFHKSTAPGSLQPRSPQWAPYCIASGSTLSLLWLMNPETASLGARPTLIVVAVSALTLLAIAVVPLNFKARVTIGLVMAIVIVGFTEVYSFRALLQTDESQSWVVHTHVVLAQIDVMAQELAEAEAASRGYMWTGEQSALNAWENGSRQFVQHLAALESLTADNPRQRQNIRQIHSALQHTIAGIESRMETQRKDGVQAGLNAFRRDEGWRVLDPVETLLNAMRKEESRLLALRILAAKESSRQTKLVVVLGNAVAALFLLVLGFAALTELRGSVKEETFRGLLESAPDAMVVADHRGTIILVNAQTERLFGYSREELLRHGVEMLVAPRLHAGESGTDRSFFQPRSGSSEAAFELSGRRKDGSEFPIELSLSPLETDQGRLVSGAFRDISEHRRIEQQLKSQTTALSQQAALLDVVPDAIFVRDLEGVISFWNRGAEMTYGYTRLEAIGKVSHELLQTGFPVDQAELIAQLRATGRWEGELHHRRANGSRLFVASRWVLRQTASDAALQVLEINNDITARKLADDEIRRLNTELSLRINDLTATNQELEAFTYTAAHDLRAPLRHMHGFAGFLRSSWYEKLDDDGRHCLDKIAASSRGMGQLLDDLLNFSRLGRVELQTNRVNLAKLVDQIRQELEPELQDRSLTWDVADLPEVTGDVGLLHQVLFNLVANAVKYTSKRQEALIEIGSCPEGSENVTVFVRDNGAGFQMEYADKLFGVFQRLHKSQEFEGTGIGLAIVRRIVERHGGRAWAQGSPGKGATFYVSLPMKGHSNGKAGIHSVSGR